MSIIVHEDCPYPDTIEILQVGEWGFGMGKRVQGRVNGCEFNALVFPDHARNSEWEWGFSRISEMTLHRNGEVVFRWGCGTPMESADAEVDAAVSILSAYLAERVYPDPLAEYMSTD